MMKKFFLILAFVMSAVLTISADDNYQFLTVQQTDGVEQSFTASGLTITFSQGNMVLNENGTTTTISLADLSKMFFSMTSGIKQMENGKGIMENGEENIEVFDLQGRKLPSGAGGRLSKLPKGIYIVNGKKIVVK